ncbi:signal peptidase I [Halobacteriales archaeon QS_4_62_28]|nr:MAG: signal peptidase I [Halobacteriales archaeon QS_4_62_28]
MSDRHRRYGQGQSVTPESACRLPGPRAVWRSISLVLIAFVLLSTFGQVAPISYVNSGSMSPTLSTGDGFVAVPTALADNPEPGDVIVYRSEEIEADGLVTHRIVGRTDEGFLTRGDSNPITDQQAGEPPVTRDRIVAHVLVVDGHTVTLPEIGTVSMWIRDSVRATGTGVPASSMELLILTGGAVLFWRGF